jgi:hypothetical protein
LPNMGGIYVAQGAMTLPGTAAASNTVGTGNAVTTQAAPAAPSDGAVAAADAPVSVGAPGFWEGLIPVWGSGRAAINAWQNESYGWAALHGAMAVTDVFLVKAAVTVPGKLLVKGVAKLATTGVGKAVVKVVTNKAVTVAAKSVAIVKGVVTAFVKSPCFVEGPR